MIGDVFNLLAAILATLAAVAAALLLIGPNAPLMAIFVGSVGNCQRLVLGRGGGHCSDRAA